MYDPTTARFLTPDPVGYRDINNGDANLYSYCGNDPVNQVDPSGNILYVPTTDAERWYEISGGTLIAIPRRNGFSQVFLLPKARKGNDVHEKVVDYLRKDLKMTEDDIKAAMNALFEGGISEPNPNYTDALDRAIIPGSNFLYSWSLTKEDFSAYKPGQYQLLNREMSLRVALDSLFLSPTSIPATYEQLAAIHGEIRPDPHPGWKFVP
jgi:hypothetical protein